MLISGSGSQDRDETIMGHKPFLVLADHLTKSGIAVLRVDDRGVGASTGDPKVATLEIHATDVEAGLTFLRGQAAIDGDKIGLIGHSEGGLIAPIVASHGAKPAFIVSLAGPGISGAQLTPLQVRALMNARGGFSSAGVDAIVAAQERVMKAIVEDADEATLTTVVREAFAVANGHAPAEQRMTEQQLDARAKAEAKLVASPWFRSFIKTDPRDSWQRVRCPVLALIGSKDTQVPAAVNLDAIRSALAANPDVTTTQLEGLNHLFQPAKSGLVDEYEHIEQTFDNKTLALISEWIKARTT